MTCRSQGLVTQAYLSRDETAKREEVLCSILFSAALSTCTYSVPSSFLIRCRIPSSSLLQLVDALLRCLLPSGMYTRLAVELIDRDCQATGIIKFIAVSNDGKPEHMIWLITLKNIFSQQLPNMPREYIARLVLDRYR